MNDDLISRSALIAEYCDGCDYPAKGLCDNDVCDFALMIKEAPAVDAVIPVRCKDCKRMFVPVPGIRYCTVWNNPNGMGDDGFCNYGERRTE